MQGACREFGPFGINFRGSGSEPNFVKDPSLPMDREVPFGFERLGQVRVPTRRDSAERTGQHLQALSVFGDGAPREAISPLPHPPRELSIRKRPFLTGDDVAELLTSRQGGVEEDTESDDSSRREHHEFVRGRTANRGLVQAECSRHLDARQTLERCGSVLQEPALSLRNAGRYSEKCLPTLLESRQEEACPSDFGSDMLLLAR